MEVLHYHFFKVAKVAIYSEMAKLINDDNFEGDLKPSFDLVLSLINEAELGLNKLHPDQKIEVFRK